ncbi:hypothetical protein BI375_07215 [Vibrio rotiferianus]|uniref:Type II secretion system protein L n=1 Tax=Vibrio rotiferianus TaxID=190895 RepID=A0ABX3D4V2_9VIBR|nr:hypothetical protein [Vibrio rotiferianus]OHY90029.1 hypothetical protein BI375_07215 [Vibrio rotiferianus]
MVHGLQRQWCIWPEQYNGYTHTAPKAKRWDKVVGLIPQQDCLFKLFYYQIDLIPQSELDSCVRNELQQLVGWDDLQYYIWTNKVGENWQVAVWFWNPSKLSFAQPLTHCLPAMVYEFGRAASAKGILVYQEQHSGSSNSWALKWQDGKVLEQLYPMHSPLHKRSVQMLLTSGELAVFTNQPEQQILAEVALAESSLYPKGAVLSQAKCSNQFDLDNPWQYWRTMVALLVILLVYMAADASLISYKKAQFDEQLATMSQNTFQLQRQRAQFQDTEKFLNQYVRAKARQQAPAKLLESLTANLAKDIVVARISYTPEKVILQGTIADTAGLLENLSTVIGVTEAKLIGEVVPAANNRQEFRAELVLEEAYQWKE